MLTYMKFQYAIYYKKQNRLLQPVLLIDLKNILLPYNFLYLHSGFNKINSGW